MIRKVGSIGCLVVVIIIVVWIVVGLMATGSCIRVSSEDPPTKRTAPGYVKTDTGIYYAKEENIVETEDQVVLIEFYELHEGEWVKRDFPLPMRRSDYAVLEVGLR